MNSRRPVDSGLSGLDLGRLRRLPVGLDPTGRQSPGIAYDRVVARRLLALSTILALTGCRDAPRPASPGGPSPTASVADTPTGPDAAAVEEPSAAADAPEPPVTQIEVVEVASRDHMTIGSDLVADDTHIYWSAEGMGIYRLARSGGAPERIVAPAPDEHVTAIAAGPRYVAWTTDDALHPGRAKLYVRAADGAVRVLVKDFPLAIELKIDRGFVYWATMGGYAGSSSTPEPAMVRRVSLDGGPVATLASAIAGATRLAFDTTHVYTFSHVSTGYADVVRFPKAGGAVEVLARAQDNPSGLAVDDREVVFSTAGPAEMPKVGPCKRPPCPVATTAPIYRHGEVRRVPKTGGDPVSLAGELARPDVLGLTTTDVVLRAHSSEILRLPRAGGAVSRVVDTRKSTGRTLGASTYVAREGKLFVIVVGPRP